MARMSRRAFLSRSAATALALGLLLRHRLPPSLAPDRPGLRVDRGRYLEHYHAGGEECIGELKGTVLMTSSNTAVYRGAGNPCVLELKFTGNKVTLKEVEGCGSFLDVKCTFDATYTRKKEPKEKQTGGTD